MKTYTWFAKLTHSAVPARNADGVLEYVYSFHEFPAIRRKGNERSARFLELSGLSFQELGRPIVKITGTNGKGTTAIRVEQLLNAAGLDTICLISPHLYTVRERIRLNGTAITWERLERTLSHITAVLEIMRGTEWQPTPTDIWTWIAFVLHASSPAPLVGVYEVGKGGLSDKTNVFAHAVVGLTNIGSDHISEFGGSKEALLIEKLGLCSTGDVLCYHRLEEDLDKRLVEYCERWSISRMPTDHSEITTEGMSDIEDAENSHLAICIVKALGFDPTPQSLQPGEIPARIQERAVAGRKFILDGAHNAEAMCRLVARLTRVVRKTRVIIFGAQIHKDWRTLIRLLAPVPGLALVITAEMTTGDSVDSETLAKWARANNLAAIACSGMLSALAEACRRDWDECVITGSFKLFRDFDLALHLLGYGAWAIQAENIDPQQRWMRTLS